MDKTELMFNTQCMADSISVDEKTVEVVSKFIYLRKIIIVVSSKQETTIIRRIK